MGTSHILLATVLMAGSTFAQQTDGTADITATAMRKTVAFLASKEMKGRRVGTPENRRAATWIAERFAKLGLKPAVDGSFFHDFTVSPYKGRNVAGMVAAPGDAEEFVVVGAHFDGIGDRRGVHRPAADDNASGVAALLAIAEAVVAQKKRLKRNVVFIAYDAEEVGLIGSTEFVNDDIIPSEDTVFALIFDMIGGRFFPWRPQEVLALGSEHSHHVRTMLGELGKGRSTAVELLGTYVLEPVGPLVARSDYRAYRRARVPYLFFSTGTPWYYHMPQDTISRIDFKQAAEIATLGLDVILRVATGTDGIDFIRRPKPEAHDLRQLHAIIGEIIDHKKAIQLPPPKFDQFAKMRDALATSIAKDKPSTRLAHRALIMVFEAAKRSRPSK